MVINGDEGMVVENRIKNRIYQQMRNKFPRENFAVMKETYLYRNDLTAKGKTHNGHFNGRVFETSVNEVLKEIMDDITVDIE